MATAKETETWPQLQEDGTWLTSDNLRFATANPDGADRLEEKAKAHQERVNENAKAKGKK